MAAFLEQTEPGRGWKIVTGRLIDSGGFERQLSQDLVEVVSADGRDAFGSDNVMDIFIQRDERSIKGTAAEVVNEHSFGTRLALTLAMAEFDAGGAGFIKYSEHFEAGVAKRLHRKEALIAVCVGRHAEDDPERIARRNAQIRALAQRSKQSAGEAVEQPGESELLFTQIE